MKYEDSRLRALLAGEYVLGTLIGRARQRFERLLLADAGLRDLVDRWEMQLNRLAIGAQPVDPPARVWRMICARLGFRQSPSRMFLWWERVNVWRAIAGVAVAATILLTVQLLRLVPETPPPMLGAVLTDADNQPGWVAIVSATHREMTALKITSLRAVSPGPGRSFELWLIPAGTSRPISLGLLPEDGNASVDLPREIGRKLHASSTIAVSLEPKGGSPTGLPTGPILYQGSMRLL